jgi:predicted DNA-binding protein YlxM (UPF0122 family)
MLDLLFSLIINVRTVTPPSPNAITRHIPGISQATPAIARRDCPKSPNADAGVRPNFHLDELYVGSIFNRNRGVHYLPHSTRTFYDQPANYSCQKSVRSTDARPTCFLEYTTPHDANKQLYYLHKFYQIRFFKSLLSMSQQKAYELYVYRGLSVDEVANACGILPSSTRVYISNQFEPEDSEIILKRLNVNKKTLKEFYKLIVKFQSNTTSITSKEYAKTLNKALQGKCTDIEIGKKVLGRIYRHLYQ